jgi:hypothetical protein
MAELGMRTEKAARGGVGGTVEFQHVGQQGFCLADQESV